MVEVEGVAPGETPVMACKAEVQQLRECGLADVERIAALDAEVRVIIERHLGEEHLDEHLRLGPVEVLDDAGDLGLGVVVGDDDERAALGVDLDEGVAKLGVVAVLARARGWRVVVNRRPSWNSSRCFPRPCLLRFGVVTGGLRGQIAGRQQENAGRRHGVQAR